MAVAIGYMMLGIKAEAATAADANAKAKVVDEEEERGGQTG